jgi:predicted GH43/DUF377 family glycosyl hydrolase
LSPLPRSFREARHVVAMGDTGMEAAQVFTKLDLELRPDPSRTVVRPFSFNYPPAFAEGRPPRPHVVVQRILSLDDGVRERMFDFIAGPMRERHRNVEGTFLRHLEALGDELGDLSGVSERDRLLIGAYFSQEYAFESAALFNPSIVRMPGKNEVGGSGIRFLLSLRGIGEGHISSVTFRTGTWEGGEALTIDPPSEYSVPPRIESDHEGWVRLLCDDSQDISETVIFPVLPSQRQGVEDLRMVNFTDDDGSELVIGTYTAYDGLNARQEMMRGVDLRTFEMRPLAGAMTGYKGMALFPRRIDGQFVMLGRQDSENIWLLRSDDLYVWKEGSIIMAPQFPWEFVQLGNCGSPIEIEEGWLVFTHGVGMVRGYCIGACLLDKADPSRVLARTSAPLIFPSAEQHGGYVPNVTYSCGALVHERRVLLPYGVGDESTCFAVADLDDLLSAMVQI